MLTQQRHEIILELLREKGSITVTEVKDLLDTSESTVRRDITALDKEGKLEKVFGGAVELKERVTAYEYSVAEKMGLKLEEKDRIAKYAAGLISTIDFLASETQLREAKVGYNQVVIDYLYAFEKYRSMLI